MEAVIDAMVVLRYSRESAEAMLHDYNRQGQIDPALRHACIIGIAGRAAMAGLEITAYQDHADFATDFLRQQALSVAAPRVPFSPMSGKLWRQLALSSFGAIELGRSPAPESLPELVTMLGRGQARVRGQKA